MARSSHGRAGAAALVAAGLVVAGSGCAVGTHKPVSGPAPRVIQVDGPGSGEERVAPSRCPAGLQRCRSAEGRIVYREAHDPDGDGDAHFVILDPRGVTLPGLTTIKVPRRLRPHPLPGLGEEISAAGQVQEGSHGEDEIHAVEVRVASARDR